MVDELKETLLKDITLIFYSLKNIDYMYSEGKAETNEDIKKLKDLIKKFNQKYPFLNLVFIDTGIQLKITFFIKDELKNVLQEALKIKDLSYINGKPYFNNKPINLTSTIELSYGDEEQNTLTFEKDNGNVKLIYEYNDLFKTDSPEFQIILVYAKKKYENIQLNANFSFDIDFFLREGQGYVYFDKVRLDK
ncbi:MAG: hypothetical protein QXR96_03515 [Candidatus Woesearchaeota archaeon]